MRREAFAGIVVTFSYMTKDQMPLDEAHSDTAPGKIAG
jgi:hypothetical protein